MMGGLTDRQGTNFVFAFNKLKLLFFSISVLYLTYAVFICRMFSYLDVTEKMEKADLIRIFDL
jgi:hypothetical protein